MSTHEMKKTDSSQTQMEALAQDVASRTAEEVIRRLNLENRTGITIGVSEGDVDMPKRLRERIMINGKERWVSGGNMQQLFDNYVRLLVNEGLIEWTDTGDESPLLKDYMRQFYSTYKQGQVETTIVNRERLMKKHIS